ncbi:MAG: aspartate--tRNA ligase [Thermodesulfovibrionales bacterium]|nr:aspartate--tRNA ligase [Thermodesulfovibrionales bacterium]
MYKDKECADIKESDIGRRLTLSGWVFRRRDHGGLIFVDLRDRSGIIQVVFSPQVSREAHELAHELRSEFVIKVKGEIRNRPPGTENPEIPTGSIELYADELKILSESQALPFQIDEAQEAGESLRLKYRYLDLRRPEIQKNIILRHRVTKAIRDFLDSEGFLEIETPMLTKSTPEGARDFLVPSRLNPGTFYALPQSPQLFKQILMISGFEKYFQIARCFRDEDLRADRQPEFTQVDMELSFAETEDILSLIERLLKDVFKKVLGIDIQIPFPRMTFNEAMERYGSDKPDTRFGLELVDVGDLAKAGEFKVFLDALNSGGRVKAIRGKGMAGLSRKEIDLLTEETRSFGAKGLAWIKIKNGFDSPITKFFPEGIMRQMADRLGAEEGDMMLFVADRQEIVHNALGRLRLELGRRLNLIKEGFYFTWIVDFPLLEWNPDEKRFQAMHHPFTSPVDADIDKLFSIKEEDMKRPDSVLSMIKAKAYDIVLNGYELGGGSIRIHKPEVQAQVFRILGIEEEEARLKFGFLIEALKYGAPPHGGIALGLDRLLMIMAGANSIRDVIAFPKTQKGVCLMSGAPSPVEPKQLKELHIKTEV